MKCMVIYECLSIYIFGTKNTERIRLKPIFAMCLVLYIKTEQA
jgi:hypothetical protein